MLVEAIYDNGWLLLPKQLNFAHHRLNVKVDLPDAEIVHFVKKVASPNSATFINEGVAYSSNVAELPEEYFKFKMLREKAFGKDYVYRQEDSDDEIIHRLWMEKHA